MTTATGCRYSQNYTCLIYDEREIWKWASGGLFFQWDGYYLSGDCGLLGFRNTSLGLASACLSIDDAYKHINR